MVCFVGAVVRASGSAHADPTDAGGGHGEEHQRSTTNTFDKRSADKGKAELETRIAEIDAGLDAVCFVTNSVENSREEVGEGSVASPLSKYDKDAVASYAIARGSRVEETSVVPPALVRALEIEIHFVLVELKLDPRGGLISKPMPLGEDCAGFVSLVMDIAPARRLGDQESTDADETGEENL